MANRAGVFSCYLRAFLLAMHIKQVIVESTIKKFVIIAANKVIKKSIIGLAIKLKTTKAVITIKMPTVIITINSIRALRITAVYFAKDLAIRPVDNFLIDYY